MRFGLLNTKVYAKEFTLSECAPGEMEINIENGSIDINISHMVKDLCKSEREKVWEMARKIVLAPDNGGMDYKKLEGCFGTRSISGVLRMPVDEALEKCEAWNKKNSVEELIMSLKPQDVVYIKGHYCEAVFGLVTRVNICASYTSIYIVCSNGYTDNFVFPDDIEHIEKIGRVVEASDILGEIKKIEDEWRKNNSCGS